jgi:hypothetical protein
VAYTIRFAELATLKRRESDCLWRSPDAGLAPPTEHDYDTGIEKGKSMLIFFLKRCRRWQRQGETRDLKEGEETRKTMQREYREDSEI